MRGREEWLPDLDILHQEGKLVVSGHRTEEKEAREEDYYCVERSSGSFRRAIRLPEGASTDAIEATYKDGVLEVQIPRPAPPEPKKLRVDVK
jgi:HSP20 family protein